MEMQSISRPIAAVRFLQTSRMPVSSLEETYEYFLTTGGTMRTGKAKSTLPFLSESAYHYFSDVTVEPGDLVIVRGSNKVGLAVVDKIVTNGTFRPTRTIIAKIDFGPAMVERRKEIERQTLTKELEQRVRARQDKEDLMARAEQYASTDETIAEMLNKLKEM